MGEFAQPILRGLTVASTAADIAGNVRQGEAAIRAAKFNIAASRTETGQQIEFNSAQSRRQRSTNITRVAKSGVRLSGSPLAVLEENEFQAERQRMFIQESGAMAQELSRMRGESALSASRVGIASSLLNGAGRIGGFAIRNA